MKGIEKVVRLRYMDGFQCLGSECPDTCCGWWEIPIDQGHYSRLNKLMSKSPEDKAAFQAAFALVPTESRTKDRFALTVLNDEQYCRFLGADRLCGLHAKHGEDYLPDVCYTYPRVYSRAGKRLELTGEPSCVEVTRRLLLREDAVVLEDAPSPSGRVLVIQGMPEVVTDPYWGMIDEVRGAFYRIVERHDYSAGQKLFFALFLATQLDRVLTPKHAGDEFSHAEFTEAIELLDRGDILAELTKRYQTAPTSTPLVMSIVGQTVASFAKGAVPVPLYRLITSVFSTYYQRGVRLDATDRTFVLEPEALLAAYSERRTALWPAIGPRVEGFLRNYLAHQVLHDWYPFAENLFLYLQNIALRVSLFRFMIVSHPEVTSDDPEALDRVAVDVVYALSRAMEHSKQLLAEADARLTAALPDFASTVELLKL